MKTVPISIVIPTRNRVESLTRTLHSLARQTVMVHEILIVDASDQPLEKNQIVVDFGSADLQIITSEASVCKQRNIGVERSSSDFIFLLDDDLTLSPDYLEKLLTHLQSHPEVALCSGLWLEKQNECWVYSAPEKSTIGLLISHIFGLSVGIDMNLARSYKGKTAQKLFEAYRKKGNRISKAGWPIITDFSSPVFTTPVYSLGASLIRKEKLNHVQFDKVFYANGIGDNYDLIMALNSPVAVLTTVKAFHYRENNNRVAPEKAYYYRVSALHYILLKHERFTKSNLLWLVFSLVGNSILFLLQGKFKMLGHNLKAMIRIIFNFPLYKPKK